MSLLCTPPEGDMCINDVSRHPEIVRKRVLIDLLMTGSEQEISELHIQCH